MKKLLSIILWSILDIVLAFVLLLIAICSLIVIFVLALIKGFKEAFDYRSSTSALLEGQDMVIRTLAWIEKSANSCEKEDQAEKA